MQPIKKRMYLFDEINVGAGEFIFPCCPLIRSNVALSDLSAISEHATLLNGVLGGLVDYASLLVVATKRLYKHVRSSMTSNTRFTPQHI